MANSTFPAPANRCSSAASWAPSAVAALVSWCWLLGQAVLPASAQPRLPALTRTDVPREPSTRDDFEPQLESGEAHRDRMTARTWFLHGHVLLAQGETAHALRALQRAWRYDPRLVSLMADILPTALAIDRTQEATRYALIACQQGQADPSLVERMAAVALEQEQWKQGRDLLRRLVPDPNRPPRTLADFRRQLELGRVHVVLDEIPQAADVLMAVKTTWQSPASYGLATDDLDASLEDPSSQWTLMAETFLAAGKFAAADEAFSRVYHRAEQAALLKVHQARLAWKQGTFEQIVPLLAGYWQQSGTEGGLAPYQLLEQIELNRGAADAAARYLRRLRALHEQCAHDPFYQLECGRVRIELQQYAEAVNCLEELHQQQPTVNSTELLARAYRGLDDDEALLRLLADVADRSSGLQSLGSAFEPLMADQALRGQLSALAQQWYDSFEAPGGTAWALALWSKQAQAWDDADAWVQRAAAQPGIRVHQLWRRWGLELLAAGQPRRAIAAWELALPLTRRSRQPELYAHLAEAWLECGETAPALQAARASAAMAWATPFHTSREGWVLYRAGRCEEAAASLQTTVARYESRYRESDREELRDVRRLLAAIHAGQGHHEQAVVVWESILDEFPADADTLNDLGYSWADRDQHRQRALQMIRQAVAADPSNASYLDSLGWALYRAGLGADAVRQLERATKLAPKSSSSWQHLGDVLYDQSQPQRAAEAWARAQSLGQPAGNQPTPELP